MISVDDYHSNNLKLADLFDKYKIQAMFAIECMGVEKERQIKELSDRGFLIASHTVTHAHLSTVSHEQAWWELRQSKDILEQITGRNIEWIVYPRGRYNNETIDMCKRLGYKYGRTTKLYDKGSFELGGNHLSYPRDEYNGVDPFEWAYKSELDHYWLHVFEVEKFDLWDKLEQFLKWYKNETLYLGAR